MAFFHVNIAQRECQQAVAHSMYLFIEIEKPLADRAKFLYYSPQIDKKQERRSIVFRTQNGFCNAAFPNNPEGRMLFTITTKSRI
jgi:hypothetical protein